MKRFQLFQLHHARVTQALSLPKVQWHPCLYSDCMMPCILDHTSTLKFYCFIFCLVHIQYTRPPIHCNGHSEDIDGSNGGEEAPRPLKRCQQTMVCCLYQYSLPLHHTLCWVLSMIHVHQLCVNMMQMCRL